MLTIHAAPVVDGRIVATAAVGTCPEVQAKLHEAPNQDAQNSAGCCAQQPALPWMF